MIKLLQGDCLELMNEIPNKSIDMILCDLPYGTTRNKWDSTLPLDELWKQYKRIIKDRGAIVLFGSQPFTSQLVCSNLNGYKYDWIWDKCNFANPLNAKVQPLKNYEVISVFGKDKKGIVYYPQGLIKLDEPLVKKGGFEREHFGHVKPRETYTQKYTNYPRALALQYKRPSKNVHPTQKPVDLLTYLLKTYTLEGETVLDNCMGSGSTGVACVNTKRNFIGIEKEPTYFNIAQERINKALEEMQQDD